MSQNDLQISFLSILQNIYDKIPYPIVAKNKIIVTVINKLVKNYTDNVLKQVITFLIVIFVFSCIPRILLIYFAEKDEGCWNTPDGEGEISNSF